MTEQQRVPTEAEWGLVAKLMKLKGYLRSDDRMSLVRFVGMHDPRLYFDPLGDSNCTDALVRAMQAARYKVERSHWDYGDCPTICDVYKREGPSEYRHCAKVISPTNRYATTFACVDALAEAERKSAYDSEDFAHDSVTK